MYDSTNSTIRDLRYVDENGTVRLRPEYARDVVKPDTPEQAAKIAKFFRKS